MFIYETERKNSLAFFVSFSENESILLKIKVKRFNQTELNKIETA